MDLKLNCMYTLSETEKVKIVRDMDERPVLTERLTVLEKTDILPYYGAQGSYEAARNIAVTLEDLRDEHEVRYVLLNDLFLDLEGMDRFQLCSKIMQNVDLNKFFIVSYFDCYADENVYSFPSNVVEKNLLNATDTYRSYIEGEAFRAIFYDMKGNETDRSGVYYGKEGLKEMIESLGVKTKVKTKEKEFER